jgi:hypothetical protein
MAESAVAEKEVEGEIVDQMVSVEAVNLPKKFNLPEAVVAEVEQSAKDCLVLAAGIDRPTGAQYKTVRAAATKAVSTRTSIAKTEKALKDEVKDYIKKIIDFAAGIKGKISKPEEDLKGILEWWDAVKAADKEKAAQEAEDRMNYIMEAINWMGNQIWVWDGKTAAELEYLRTEYKSFVIGDTFEEFEAMAQGAHQKLLEQIDQKVIEVTAKEKFEADRAQELADAKAEKERLHKENIAAKEKLAKDSLAAQKVKDDADAKNAALQKELDDMRAAMAAQQAEQAKPEPASAETDDEVDKFVEQMKEEKTEPQTVLTVSERAESDLIEKCKISTKDAFNVIEAIRHGQICGVTIADGNLPKRGR